MKPIATIQPKNILKMVEEKLQIPNLKIKDIPLPFNNSEKS